MVIILAWILSVAFLVAVAFTLPWISSSPVPYTSKPWMETINLKFQQSVTLTKTLGDNLAKLESERYLFKAGFIQWFCSSGLGNQMDKRGELTEEKVEARLTDENEKEAEK
ncbi:hypothetical protein YC2023_086723 [Brassica napus]